ncbi:MAG TPA: ATP-binding protein, partial [Polyangiaceae bacterium]|nr:ATP-binding protein [Polyangiaceae bacterium]
RQDVLGKTVREVFPELPEDAPLFRMLADVYTSGKPFAASDFRVVLDRQGRGASEDAYFNVTCQPVRDESGNVGEIICVALDVTPEVQARQRIESLIEELQLADQRKNEFLATLAHELRNPMAAISTALSLLDSADLDVQKAPSYMDAARRQMNNLVRIVDDLLDVARITRGKIELRKEALELAEVVENAVQATRPAIEARRHVLHVSVESEPLIVHADATRIEQIVVNLLTNAAKYTEPGGYISVEVGRESRPAIRQSREGREARAARAPGHAVIRVSDTGRGIPRDMLDKVFDLFTQVSPSIDRNTGGLGLGLTLVKHLAEMHGGSVGASSGGAGKGSEFTIRLPLLPHPDPSSRKRSEPAAGSHRGGPLQAESPAYRVLIVEDSEDVRELLAECLRSIGHEVHMAADGLDGAERFGSVQPDVALLDVGLPGIDGYELARRIRSREGGSAAYLVALTGYGGVDVKREAERAGFNLQLTKPIDMQGLRQLFAAYEARKRA